MSLKVRPSALLCAICRAGGKPGSENDSLIKALRNNPRTPVTLVCDTESAYRCKMETVVNDFPGSMKRIKRDLDILQMLGLVPGSTRPADELFRRIADKIKTSGNICGPVETKNPVWQGCPYANSGYYGKGLKKWRELIIPERNKNEKEQAKIDSVTKMHNAEKLEIRPHHLLCTICFYGNGLDGPLENDNIYEFVAIMKENNNVPIVLVRGCCMLCAPCENYDPKSGLCVNVPGISLRDDKKDLEVLSILQMNFGDELPARKLYGKIFKKINSTQEVCGFDNTVTAPEWSVCGSCKRKVYEKSWRRFAKDVLNY